MFRVWRARVGILVLMVGCGLRGWGQAASITVTGSEQTASGVWDSGTATLTVNSYSKTLSGAAGYGQFSSPASIASWLAARISMDTSAPVWAKANGATITVAPRIPGTPLSVSGSTTYDTGHFGSPSFGFGTSSGPAPRMVLNCTPSSIGPGQVSNCTASIQGVATLSGAPIPTNQVVFTVNSSSWTSVSVGGDGDAVATGGLSGASAATYTIAASYAADSYYPAMSASTTVTVGSGDPATSAVYQYDIYQSDESTSGFDGVGNVIAYFDTTSGQWTNIQYDALNRLVRADGPAAFNSSSQYFCWTYDNFGNRTSQNHEGTGAFSVVSTV
jgi:hypothetical protein